MLLAPTIKGSGFVARITIRGSGVAPVLGARERPMFVFGILSVVCSGAFALMAGLRHALAPGEACAILPDDIGREVGHRDCLLPIGRMKIN